MRGTRAASRLNAGAPFRGACALRRLVLVLCLAAPCQAAPAQTTSAQTGNAQHSQVQDVLVNTRAGVTVDIRLAVPDGARALLVLLEGGTGVIDPGYQGFAHRVFARFPPRGIATVLIGAPTRGSGFRTGLDPKFRESRTHTADINAVVTRLKRDLQLPVWVLGVSNGTRSAAAYAMRHSAAVAGLVLVSSSTSPPNGIPIQDLPEIAAVTVPVLTIAHRDDACLGSPPSGAAAIASAASAAPRAAAIIFSGGSEEGSLPCGVLTHHQLYGNEDAAVDAIAWFIDSETADAVRLSTIDAR